MERTLRLIRELNTSNVEIYKLEEYKNENVLCYFMLLDTNRKATLEDFPHLKGVISKEDINGDNYIKGFVVSAKEINEELAEQLGGIMEELSFHLFAPSQEWNYTYKIITEKEFKKIQTNREYMLNFFDNLLKNEGCNYKITSINEEDYNHLTQKTTER